MSIRDARLEDVAEILQIYTPYVETTTHSFEWIPPPLSEFQERFRTITARFPWLVWEESGSILGYAYGSAPFSRAAYMWTCEVSIYLRPECTGRGLGRKLYGHLEEILKSLGYRKIYAVITDENTDSLAFHRALGYQPIARLPGCGYKLGHSVGTVWMEKNFPLPAVPETPPALYSRAKYTDTNYS